LSLKIKKKDREHALLERGFLKLSAPVKSFIDSQVVTGIVLFVSVIIAMVMVNFGWQQTYDALNAMKLSVSLGDWEMSHSIHYWINDGLMVLFFFILGLEIKYEVLVGALSNIKDAGLVIAMAVGGMLFPALIKVGVYLWQQTRPLLLVF
jgi:NhaA family Na+:H+ antiporter